MEQSTKYLTEPIEASLYTENKREQVLHSPYFQCVASTADSMIIAGKLLPGREKELIEKAIAFTDMLIEKVGQKI